MAEIKEVALIGPDGNPVYPKTYTPCVVDANNKQLDVLLAEKLTTNKFLPFSAFNVDLDVTLQMASTMRSGEPIFYIQKHNVFAIEKNGLYYPAWGTTADMTESLKYNNGNGTVGYTAREDNVYIAEINDMYVIIDGFVALVTNIGTMLDVARTSLGWQIAGIKDNIDDLLSRVETLEAQLA